MQVAIPLKQFAAAGPATHTCAASLILSSSADSTQTQQATISERKHRRSQPRQETSLALQTVQSLVSARSSFQDEGDAGAGRKFDAQVAKKSKRTVGKVKFRFNYFVDVRSLAGDMLRPAQLIPVLHMGTLEQCMPHMTCYKTFMHIEDMSIAVLDCMVDTEQASSWRLVAGAHDGIDSDIEGIQSKSSMGLNQVKSSQTDLFDTVCSNHSGASHGCVPSQCLRKRQLICFFFVLAAVC